MDMEKGPKMTGVTILDMHKKQRTRRGRKRNERQIDVIALDLN